MRSPFPHKIIRSGHISFAYKVARTFIEAHEDTTNSLMHIVQRNAIRNFTRRRGDAFWEECIDMGTMILTYCPTNNTTPSLVAYGIDMVNPERSVAWQNFLSADATPSYLSGDTISKHGKTGVYNDILNYGMSVYKRNAAASTSRRDFGAYNTSPARGTQLNYTTTNVLYISLNTELTSSSITDPFANSTGLLRIQHNGTELTFNHRGSVLYTNSAIARTTPNNLEIYIHGYNANNALSLPTNQQICYIGIKEPIMTPTAESAYNSDVQLLQQEIITGGRHV